MLSMLVLKEWRQQWRNRQLLFAFILLCFLGVVSLTYSYFEHRKALATYAEGMATARDHWLSQGEKNPHSAAHYGLYVFKLPAPLSVLDQGVAPFMGVATFTEAHVKNDATYESALDQSGAWRFGVLTPTFLLVYLVPLFLIFACFDRISGERERGTWRLVLSCRAKLFPVLLSKWLSLYMLAMIVAVGVILFGSIMATLLEPGVNLWQQCLWLLLGYALYYAAFLNVGLLVSANCARSHVAMVVLIIFWVVCQLVVPKWAASWAEQRFPTPDRAVFHEQMQQQKADGMDGHNPKDERVAQIRNETLEKYGVIEVSELPINIDGLLMQQDEVYGNRVYDAFGERIQQVHASQRSVFLWSSLLSLALPMRQWSLGMTWGDLSHHQRFNAQVETYRRDWVEMLNTDMMQQSRSGDWSYKADQQLWQQVAPFEFEPAGIEDQVQHNAAYLISLLLWWLVSGLALFGWIHWRGGMI